MALHVKKGDLVYIRTGNDKGRTGRVLRVDPKKQQVVVEGMNVRKRHVKPNQNQPQGGRIDKEMPIHISNVLPQTPGAPKGTRVRFQTKPDGSKVRVAVKGGEVLSTLRKA
jgi:large subunit ribosomal protein L24